MSDDAAIPGWLPGLEPERHAQQNQHFITRSRLLNCSTLTDAQITALVKDGRLAAYAILANKRTHFFDLDEVNALFTPVLLARVGKGG